jgi:hypothetical protein
MRYGRRQCRPVSRTRCLNWPDVTAPHGFPSSRDFSAFGPQATILYLLYLRARYFMCIGKYEIALAVAQTALTICAQERGITFPEIYLRSYALSPVTAWARA